MTTKTRNRIYSSGSEEECHWSDCDSSGDDDSDRSPKNTVAVGQRQRWAPYTLLGNGALLYDLSGHISGIWKQVGRNLPMRECIIENIDIDHEREGEREKAYQLLLTWTRQLGSKATLHDLLNVLVYIGRSDIANAISVSNKQQRASICSERGFKVEIKSHAKLQKQVLRKLKDACHFYQERLREVEDLQRGVFEEREAQEMRAKLQELDKTNVQRKLDSLQEQIYDLQEKDQSIELDQQLRIVADKLYELDKTFKQFNDSLDDLRVASYSQIECSFVGLCYFRHTVFPRGSSSGKRRPSSKGDEELDNDVFQDRSAHDARETESKPSRHSRLGLTRNTLSRSSLSKLFRHSQRRSKASTRTRGGQEEHTKRKLSVSMIDIDEQFQLQDFVTKFCRRYRQDRPFLYSHCCMNRYIQGSPDEVYPRTQALSSIDPNTLPFPRYQSTEAIYSLVARPFGTIASRGFVNVAASDWV